jgi:uncharacterized damage-inducible protein DinB
MIAPEVERSAVPLVAHERAMLDAWLDYHRATLLMKCAGLSEVQLKLRAVEPSTLSLLGLVRHMTDVERGWFRRRIGGETGPEAARLYSSEERPDGDFDDVDGANPETALSTYLEEIDRCRVAASNVSLDDQAGDFSVRWIYLHMIEEYARHNGHADLLRERIDGSKGD